LKVSLSVFNKNFNFLKNEFKLRNSFLLSTLKRLAEFNKLNSPKFILDFRDLIADLFNLFQWKI
jgi:hypothetical protein